VAHLVEHLLRRFCRPISGVAIPQGNGHMIVLQNLLRCVIKAFIWGTKEGDWIRIILLNFVCRT